MISSSPHLTSDEATSVRAAADQADSADSETIDWATFRFPPRPPKRNHTDGEGGASTVPAPMWASPPREIRTWHLDMDRLLIIHPVHRKKIDLTRVCTKHRLIQLCQLVKKERTDEDVASLWRSIDDACVNAWGMSLPEILANAPDKWVWPHDTTDTLHDD